METAHATQTQTEVNSCDPTQNTTSCVWASPDVDQAPAESPQTTKAAKKRMRKAVKKQYHKIVTDDGDVKSIPLNGDALAKAKETDEATARRLVIDGVQADATYLAARLENFTELAIAEDEAKQKRIVFADTFRDPEVRKKMQNVRDFFATKKECEFLLGKDGVTQYLTAPDYFRNECGVTYEYVRRLTNDARFKAVAPLLTDGTAQRPQPRTRQPRVPASDSASGNVNVNELPEKTRKNVLATIKGTPMETPITVDDSVPPPQQEEANHAASVDEKVRFVLAYSVRFAKLMSLDDREDFYFKLAGAFRNFDADTLKVPD